MSTFGSHLEWYRSAPEYVGVPQEFRASGRGGVTLIRSGQPAGSYFRPASNEFTLQLQLSSGAVGRVDHGERFATTTSTNRLVLSPIGIDLGYEVDGPASFMVAVVPYTVVESALASDVRRFDGDFGSLHAANFRDDVVTALMKRLWADEGAGSPRGRLFADSAWVTILNVLWLRRSGDANFESLTPGSSIDWRVRRVIEYLEARMAEDVGLGELGGVAGLSSSHFTALFRASTGLPPHRWLTKRRVERACEMLADPRQSVTEIAHTLGFASSQHLATVFKKHMGATPTEYRNKRMS